jgi:hypothetical protein
LRGIALWGESKAEIWRPRSDQFQLLRDERGLAALSPKSIFAAVSAWFG